MPPQNILINSLKESFISIWKNKSLFFLLFLIQIIFFIILAALSYHYQSKIIESSNAIFDYVSKQKLDDATVAQNVLQQKNLLGDDPLSISRNFRDIVRNFRIYLAYVFIFLTIFLSVSWTLTNRLINKPNFKKLVKHLSKSLIILLFYLGLIFAFFYSLLGISITQIASESAQLVSKFVPFLIFSIVLIYFMFVSLSLLKNTELKNIIQRTLSVGIRKAHYIIAVYLVIIILLGLSIYLLLNFLEKNLFILLLSLLLMVFSFVFGRILMTNAVEKLGIL